MTTLMRFLQFCQDLPPLKGASQREYYAKTLKGLFLKRKKVFFCQAQTPCWPFGGADAKFSKTSAKAKHNAIIFLLFVKSFCHNSFSQQPMIIFSTQKKFVLPCAPKWIWIKYFAHVTLNQMAKECPFQHQEHGPTSI